MKTTTRITQSIMAIAASLLLVATAHPTVTADSGPTAPEEPRVDECGYCWPGESGRHFSAAAWVPMSGAGYGDGWHALDEDGECLFVHGICVFVPRRDGEEQAQDAVEVTDAIAAAAASRDVEALAKLAMAPSVQLTAQRTAIQVIGCDGLTVVGHFPIDRALFSAVEIATDALVIAP